jgi:hypothetical protein
LVGLPGTRSTPTTERINGAEKLLRSAAVHVAEAVGVEG